MRADLFSRSTASGRLLGVALIALAATGCKTEKDPDQPTLLGAPPTTAYLGVEYYYNWGAYGGESILDYSLTNAPSWLALEDTSNKARQGIIMRGVPGLSGGNRGEADLGQTENIEIVTTDGRMAGFQPFDIDVKRNVITLAGANLKEGESQDSEDESEERCAVPELDAGSYSYELQKFTDEGAPDGTESVTYPTKRAYVKVNLDQPSVTEVKIAFELRSDFDPTACDNDETDPAHQDCQYSRANTGAIIIGEDLVALSDELNHPVDKEGNPLEYIEYDMTGDTVTSGVVTLKPGITECYIPFEVVDDLIPEPTEVATMVLTEVRQGIASLGNGSVEVKANISIEDNEPLLSIETVNGGSRDTINTETTREYRAILTGDRKTEFRAKLARIGALTGVIEDETFEIVQKNAQDDYDEIEELVFPLEQDEITFGVRALAYNNQGEELDDNAAPIGVDVNYQAGRAGYARGASETLLRLNLNRLIAPLAWNDGFVATDVALGHEGRVFVAGYVPGNNQVQVRIYDQAGAVLQDPIDVTSSGLAMPPSEVFLDVGVRTVTENNNRVNRYEIAVAFSSDEAGLGTPVGGVDAVTALFHFNGDSGNYVPSWDDEIYRIGTPADDSVRWVGINGTTGYVLVGGETRGAWNTGAYQGGTDSFLARIDTAENAGALEPTLAWARQVGSSGNETVVGGSSQGSLALLFGSSPMTLDGLGNVGPYFFNGNTGESPTVYQVGEDNSESLGDGLYGGAGVVLVGDAPYSYRFREAQPEDAGTDNAEDEIIRTPLDNRAGFVLGFNTSGEPLSAYTVDDADDLSNELLTSGVRFDGDIVVSGNTNGSFVEGQAAPVSGTESILARVDTSESGAAFRNWRKQLAFEGLEILDLENYRDDELVVLADRNGERMVLVFSPEGELLTPITP
ncbi:hypothetical protein Q667_02700 [Marinobacter sp. C1S70]|uniref:hypothetical protein n=1 Tax=Marinobacter sp. C1S70 TaxID=1396859 RepID=UPI0003B8A354|nr:hypothetical protein [Marinobacter sp. C1S70]ERS85541.1 hypothetical protein Q667_02700 [Marinobacter sp. C1S70]